MQSRSFWLEMHGIDPVMNDMKDLTAHAGRKISDPTGRISQQQEVILVQRMSVAVHIVICHSWAWNSFCNHFCSDIPCRRNSLQHLWTLWDHAAWNQVSSSVTTTFLSGNDKPVLISGAASAGWKKTEYQQNARKTFQEFRTCEGDCEVEENCILQSSSILTPGLCTMFFMCSQIWRLLSTDKLQRCSSPGSENVILYCATLYANNKFLHVCTRLSTLYSFSLVCFFSPILIRSGMLRDWAQSRQV